MFRGFLFSLYGLLSTARNIPGIFQQVRPVVGCGYGQLVAEDGLHPQGQGIHFLQHQGAAGRALECAADAVATPDRESEELRWVDVNSLPGNLHPAFAASWPEVKAMVLAQSA